MARLKDRPIKQWLGKLISTGLSLLMITWLSSLVMQAQAATREAPSAPPAFSPTLRSREQDTRLADSPSVPMQSTSPLTTVEASQVAGPHIIGGDEAPLNAWPWTVALVSADNSNAYYGIFCGGSLISPEWVLTAAHCVRWQMPFNFDVVLGRHTLSSTDGERIPAARVIIHPLFNAETQDYDLALVQLSQPSARPTLSFDAPEDARLENNYSKATVIGWGRTDVNSYLGSNELRQVELPLVPTSICNAPYAHAGVVTENMICAGYADGEKSACHGDSGGPLVVPDEQTAWVQVGIVSWGSALCTGPDQYNVYTRVSRFKNWIKSCLADPDAVACNPNNGKADPYEPDDSPAAAGVISTTSEAQFRTFDKPGDNDWVKIAVKAGVVYVMETADLGYSGNTVMWLYASDGKTIIERNSNTSAGLTTDFSSRIVWTAPQDGTVYLQLLALDSRRFGANTQYSLRVRTINQALYLPLVTKSN